MRAGARWKPSLTLDGGDLIVSGVTGGQVAHPLLACARESAKLVVKLAGEFGMSPASRARVRAGVGGAASKFG